ncbi:BA75_01550T0 [Komagataella pastoris]|uniref:Lysophospholipase NTE1 n=1 Tax=Komagataella pastoris TaxID=4922 RepID=A0A1B2J935_PICPA|nr:BA75_01550T0 [Komagataella pastoris]
MSNRLLIFLLVALIQSTWVLTNDLPLLSVESSNPDSGLISVSPTALSPDVGTLSTDQLADNGLPSPRDSTSSISFVTATIWFLSWCFFKVIRSVLVVLPSFIVRILGFNYSVTLNFSSLLMIVSSTVVIVYAFIRYRYLNLYSRLPQEPKRQDPPMDVFIESTDDNSEVRFPSYLDQFLSAIKVFGYLEKTVFHELTKSMTTQKLELNESLVIDASKGFSIVIEGRMSVYARVGRKIVSDDTLAAEYESANSDEKSFIFNGYKYQLLTDAKSGSPLSSLISILKLFTEHEDKLSHDNRTSSALNLNAVYEASSPFREEPSSSSPEEQADPEEFAPELIAKAQGHASISTIPPESFRRLVVKYPQSASHIVQMVLTRLYRVTLQTAHSYLGLTHKIMKAELELNMLSQYDIPVYLHDGIIDRLDNQFKAAEEEDTNETINVSKSNSNFKKTNGLLQHHPERTTHDKRFFYYNPPGRISKSSSSKPSKRPVLSKRNSSHHVVLDTRITNTNPGDLLSNVPLSRKNSSYNSLRNSDQFKDEQEIRTRTFSAEEETEDTALRTALVESIFKLIGIDNSILHNSANLFSSYLSLNDPLNSPNFGLQKSYPSSQNLKWFSLDVGDDDDSSCSSKSETPGAGSHKSSEPALDLVSIRKSASEQIQFMFIKAGHVIIEENQPTPGIYYVVSGLLESVFTAENGEEKMLNHIKPGGIAGYLGVVASFKSFITVRAKANCYVGFLPKKVIDSLCDKYSVIQLALAKTLIRVLDDNILLMDFAMDWVQTSAGQRLYNQGDPANGIYIVLNGRFRSIVENPKGAVNDKQSSPVIHRKDAYSGENDSISLISEHGRGESLGEIEVLTASKRPTTLVAVRDSETARIPRTLFEMLCLTNPSIMIKVSRLVAQRSQSTEANLVIGANSFKNPVIKPKNSSFCNYSYRTITILPVTKGLPVEEFAQKLVSSFEQLDRSVISLNQASILTHLGKHAFDKLAKMKQSGYFADLEEQYQNVIYVTDTPVNSTWTSTCISQGDIILLLADAQSSTDIGEYERLLVRKKTTARTELILLHPERYVEAGSTSKFLKNRIWVHSHHHVQMNVNRGHFVAKATELSSIAQLVKESYSQLKNKAHLDKMRHRLETLLVSYDVFKKVPNIGRTGYYQPTQEHKNDFMRLARILSGQAIGLVFGGGGARGCAHIGVLKALEEYGIPVDLVGGTSIGAFVGGLYAKDYNLVSTYGRTKSFAGRMSSLWRILTDLTYPVTSYMTGHEFNRGIWKAFGDYRIEDFWVKYYCNSTNITNSVQEIHSSGYAWRYIRASMTLAGLLPPITDNGSMLLDGGYVDNLPVEEMKNQGASVIFAIDVGSVDDRSPMDYGDSLSGFWVVLNRWNPFSKHPNVPSIAEIQLRLAYVASVNALEQAKSQDAVVYLRPPIEMYGTLDFGKFEEISNVGNAYGSSQLKELEADNELPEVLKSRKKQPHKINIDRRNSI